MTAPVRRTAVIVDGPLAGRDTRVPLDLRYPVPTWCSKPIGGEWRHHVRDGDVFRYAGTCAQVGHDDVVDMCDRTWRDRESGAHNCTAIGEHEEHRCCCGEVAA